VYASTHSPVSRAVGAWDGSHFRHGGWFGQIKDRPEVGKVALEEALAAVAMLLGRRSYEFFTARWPSRRGELAGG
jgi:hypothetical protein